jgi:segregation and condensation protein A
MNPEDATVDSSLLTKFRKTRITEDILEEMLGETVRQAIELGVIKSRMILVDATHSKTSAKYETPTQILRKLTKELRKELYRTQFELSGIFPEKPLETADLNDEIELDFESEEHSDGYEFRLKDFDGPLDTLCHLIRKFKYSIEDVRISEITEQYMEYMEQLSELDLEQATDFVNMAAWLLEIKSKALLPRPITEEEAQDDPEKLLKQRLEEYTLFKQASLKMKEVETVDIHYRAPDETVGQPKFILKSMDLSGLMNALHRVFLKIEERAGEIKERHIVKDRFTVAEKISHIKDVFLLQDTYSFFSLFDEEYSKSEIISTFQALLELLKMQYLTAEQSETYGDIVLRRVDGEVETQEEEQV